MTVLKPSFTSGRSLSGLLLPRAFAFSLSLVLTVPLFSAFSLAQTTNPKPSELKVNPAPQENRTKKEVKQQTINAKATLWRGTDATVVQDSTPSDLKLKAEFPSRAWWEQFQDPFLTTYIEQALTANLNLQNARQRVLEARALARQSLGKEMPQLSIQPAFTRSRSSATSFPSFGASRTNANNSGTGGGTGGTGTGGMGNAGTGGVGGFPLGMWINNYTVPLIASYEADIWFKNRDATRAATKTAESMVDNLASAQSVLAADVATAYFNLVANDRLIAEQKEIIATAEADLANAQRLYDAGASDQENVVLRQGRLTDYKAQLQDLSASQSLAINQLAVLMGQTPYSVGQLQRADWDKYAVPSEVPVGIPAELLLRRPDILAAEKQMAAAGYQVRVARKDMLPALNLTGQFGFATATYDKLFNWESYLASGAASLLQPLFTGGQKRANLKVYKARYQQQLLNYRNVVLTSCKEVDDALANLKAHRNAYQNYSDSMESLVQRRQIQQNRLAVGVIAESELNPVQLEVLQAQQGLTRTKLLALTDSLSLYKALGGGY